MVFPMLLPEHTTVAFDWLSRQHCEMKLRWRPSWHMCDTPGWCMRCGQSADHPHQQRRWRLALLTQQPCLSQSANCILSVKGSHAICKKQICTVINDWLGDLWTRYVIKAALLVFPSLTVINWNVARLLRHYIVTIKSWLLRWNIILNYSWHDEDWSIRRDFVIHIGYSTSTFQTIAAYYIIREPCLFVRIIAGGLNSNAFNRYVLHTVACPHLHQSRLKLLIVVKLFLWLIFFSFQPVVIYRRLTTGSQMQ